MHEFVLEAFASPLPDAEIYRQCRATSDLYRRSARGPIYYAAGSIVFVLSLGRPQDQPLLAWLPALLFAFLGVARWLHRPPAEGSDLAAYRRWRLLHWLLIDLGCLLWSGHLLMAGALGQPYSDSLLIALGGTAAYVAAVSHMFAMDRRAAAIALACLTLPGTLAYALVFPHGLAYAFGLGIYTIYSLAMIDFSAKDYAKQLSNEYALMQANAQNERLVATDALTGLANRREYERRFAQAWHLAARQGGDLALLVLDLDNFKQLNDTHGHPAGDSCLRHFAEILRQHFRRACDLTARIGGEEFAVILPGVTARDAAALGEEFRRALAETPCLYRDKQIPMTASIGAGAADWRQDADPLATFARIDQACYSAKRQGRSRLVSA